MNGLILGLYGIYLVVIGITGKSEALQLKLQEDMPKFIPWALAIVVLVILAQSEATAKLVKPFVGLLILNFVLVNYSNLSLEVRKLRDLSGVN